MSAKVITILGGTGRVGRELAALAVTAGHIVIVLGREPVMLGDLRHRVQVIDGEATDAATIDHAVGPSDVVISVLGRRKGGPADVLTQAMTHTVAAMERHSIRRIVLLTAVAELTAPARSRWLAPMLDRIRPATGTADHAGALAVLSDSDLDWTIVRAEPALPRRRIAAFLLDCAVTGSHLHAMPVLTAGRPPAS